MKKKKIVVVTLIGILTLVILTIGATYAYFQFNSQNNFDTGVNIQGSTEAVGTGAVLRSVTKSLTLDVSATDMLESNIGTSYYASGSSTPATIGEISVDMDGNYACTYTVVVRESASSYENNLYTKAVYMTSTKYPEQFYLDINDTRYNLSSVEVFPVIHTEKIIINKDNPYNITTNLVITNTDVDQTALNGGDITLNYEVMDFNCEYMASVDTVIGYAVYSADDKSLTFYNNEEVKSVSVGDTYNNKTVTAIYPINIVDEYKGDCVYDKGCTNLTTPWGEYATDITNIKVEDEIYPWNTNYWFAGLANVTKIDVINLQMDNVIDMKAMFFHTSSNVTELEIQGLSEFNTSNVINMEHLLNCFGQNVKELTLDISKWNTGKVKNFKNLFSRTGQNSNTFTMNIGSWDVSNALNMAFAFERVGEKATSWSIGDLSTWDTKNVINMISLFTNGGRNAEIFNIGNIGGWDVSNVTYMGYTFNQAGRYSTEWNIGDISNWNVSSVYNMQYMFNCAGENADYTLDLSTWNVSNVVKYNNFNVGVTTKITPPTWVN